MLNKKAFRVSETIAIAKKEKDQNEALFDQFQTMSNTQVDHLMEDSHDEVFAEHDCLTCANCCKTTSPIIEPIDIDRIALALNMKPVEFKIEYLIIDEDGDYVFYQSPCPFLEEDNRCRVYEHRPRACREYPHTNRKKAVQIRDLTIKNSSICPAVSMILSKIRKGLHA